MSEPDTTHAAKSDGEDRDLPSSVDAGAPERFVARGATELSELIALAEAEGFGAEFDVPADADGDRDALDGDVEDGRAEGALDALHCSACRRSSPSSTFDRAWSRRLEGASDPSDMLHVSALTCPSCGTRGIFISPFGSTATERQAAVLRSLRDVEDEV